MEHTKNAGPLSHLRVLDLTQFLSGPYATQILGDLGAEIIKIEPPEGDMTRRLPPHFVGTQSAYYLSVNRNKKSLSIDMKLDAGRKLVRNLMLSCDVVVENFRPGTLGRLGLCYDDVAAEKPGLIWCCISGFGQDGPYANRPAYDMIVQAMSGAMSLTGEPDGAAVRSGIPLGDIGAGIYGVVGILAALAERDRTGRGKLVDIAMLDCQVAMLSYQVAYCLASGQPPHRQGSGHDSIPTYRSFTCNDGIDVVITANTERMWSNLCAALELDELVDDERFRTNEKRYTNRFDLWKILEGRFASKPADVWIERMISLEVPAAMVNTLERSLSDPQVLHRNMVIAMTAPTGEKLCVAGTPIKFRSEPELEHSYPPLLGADNHTILTSVLGLSRESMESLEKAGVFGRRACAVAES